MTGKETPFNSIFISIFTEKNGNSNTSLALGQIFLEKFKEIWQCDCNLPEMELGEKIIHLYSIYLQKNAVFPTVVIGQMLKKFILKHKQVEGESFSEKWIRTYKSSKFICSYHSTTFLQAFGKLNYRVKRNVMSMFNNGLNQRLNFGYF